MNCGLVSSTIMRIMWLPPFGASFRIDTLTAIMALLAGYLTLSAGLFAGGYFKGGARLLRGFRAWLSAFFGVCLGIVLSADWLTFLVFWELLTLIVYFLICYSDRKTALRYCVAQIAGASLLSMGIAQLYVETGTLAMGPVPGHLAPFFVGGIGVKTALLGLHFWLPDAHSKAPAPVSALLSGYIVKLGAYGFIRMTAGANELLLWIGGLMTIYGVFFALLQHDAKCLLAYHTISQVGHIMAAIGVGTEIALGTAVYHMVTHALFKGLLFLSVGTVEADFGTRDLRFLGGVARLRPLTFAAFLIGAAAISGLPGTSGFASKVMVKHVMGGHDAISFALMVTGVGTVISFAKLMYYAFLGDISRPADPGGMIHMRPSAAPASSRNIGMLVLAAATVFVGIRPRMIPDVLGIPSPSFFTLSNVGLALLTILAGTLAFAALRETLRPKSREVPDIDHLMNIAVRGLAYMPRTLQAIHNGSVRFYASWTVAAIIILLYVWRV